MKTLAISILITVIMLSLFLSLQWQLLPPSTDQSIILTADLVGLWKENLPIEEAFENLRCSREGLMSEAVQQRLNIFGHNKLEEKKESKFLKFLGVMWKPLSVMEAAAIMAITLANGGMNEVSMAALEEKQMALDRGSSYTRPLVIETSHFEKAFMKIASSILEKKKMDLYQKFLSYSDHRFLRRSEHSWLVSDEWDRFRKNPNRSAQNLKSLWEDCIKRFLDDYRY